MIVYSSWVNRLELGEDVLDGSKIRLLSME